MKYKKMKLREARQSSDLTVRDTFELVIQSEMAKANQEQFQAFETACTDGKKGF